MKIKKILFKMFLIAVFIFCEYFIYSKYIKVKDNTTIVKKENLQDEVIAESKIRDKDFYLKDEQIKNSFVFKEKLPDPNAKAKEVENVDKTTYRNNIPINSKTEIKVTKNKIPEKKPTETKPKKVESKKVEANKTEDKKPEITNNSTKPDSNLKGGVTEIEGTFMSNPL